MVFAPSDLRTAATLDAAAFTTGIEPQDRPALIDAVCAIFPAPAD
jgi:hypothetical protein